MLIVFSIFSFLFFAKTALLSYFFSNYLIFLLYPLEISGLSLLNSNQTIDNEVILNLNTYLRWTTINWIGIDEDSLNRLFERFYRVDKNRYREIGGTGLGLAVVKHIIEAHQQTINVRSTVNIGSTFSFILEKASN